ncbi:MAG: TnsD family Tn7-like transposition protein [Pseudomonadota bacterium]|nr:TnsD family Tn7-like transposition protein [Pseudomonadota bacterium]
MILPRLLAIQPNETIFSFLVRWNKYLGFSTESYLFKNVFDKNRVRIHPYLPTQLFNIAEALEVDKSSLLIDHTLFPLFSFFNPLIREKLMERMLFSPHTVTNITGIPSAKLPLTFGHKWCPICVDESINQNGFAILKIEHQIPGVIACSTHQVLLEHIIGGDNGIDRKLTLDCPKVHPIGAEQLAIEFSSFAQEVLLISRTSELNEPRSLYREQLSQQGYITKHGYIRMSMLEDKFSVLLQDYPNVTDHHLVTVLRQKSFLGPLLREKTSFPAHPLKHLLFSFWLFEGNADLFIKTIPTKADSLPNNIDKPSNFEDKIICMLREGKSMNVIEAQTGKSRCAIRRIAELNGLEHATNEMHYSNAIKRAVQRKALMGVHRNNIAQDLSIGIGYVEQVICNTPHLSEWRKKLRHHAKVSNAEKTIKMLVTNNPSLTRTQLRALAEAEYALLYLHDKERLFSLLPKPLKPTPPNCKK